MYQFEFILNQSWVLQVRNQQASPSVQTEQILAESRPQHLCTTLCHPLIYPVINATTMNKTEARNICCVVVCRLGDGNKPTTMFLACDAHSRAMYARVVASKIQKTPPGSPSDGEVIGGFRTWNSKKTKRRMVYGADASGICKFCVCCIGPRRFL